MKLVYAKFVIALDIIEDFLIGEKIKYLRLVRVIQFILWPHLDIRFSTGWEHETIRTSERHGWVQQARLGRIHLPFNNTSGWCRHQLVECRHCYHIWSWFQPSPSTRFSSPKDDFILTHDFYLGSSSVLKRYLPAFAILTILSGYR